jgi:carbonyl reductase 1
MIRNPVVVVFICHLFSMFQAVASLTSERVVLVTGANKGIGKEISRKLGSEKDNLICILACRNEKLGKAAADELKASGCHVDSVKLDLDDAASIIQAREYVQTKYGRLDILVNNAAICFNDPTLYGKVPHTPFEKQASTTINTNFFGTLAVTKEFLPMLRESPSPRIVNIASYAGRLAILKSQALVDTFTSPDLQLDQLEDLMNTFVKEVEAGTHARKGWPNTCYGMSKVGIIALTKILARDETKIMVNSVDPGYCATDQNKNQGNRPAERGAVTPFLLSTQDDKFLTGIHWMDEQPIQW